MSGNPEEFEKRVAEAKAAFAKNDDYAKIHAAQIQTFGSDAMKAPALVAAAGVAAALGFYSANFTRLSSDPLKLLAFNDILFWLFASLLVIVCAPGMAYLSQIAYTTSLYAEDYEYDAPYTRQTRRSLFYKTVGDCLRWLAVALVVLSIACLTYGGYRFLHLLG